MSSQNPLDLSSLDPLRDPERWEQVLERTRSRVDALVASRRADPLALIASWSRHLTMAAATLTILLVPIELVLERREVESQRIRSLAQFGVRSALGEGQPTGAELSRAIVPGQPR